MIAFFNSSLDIVAKNIITVIDYDTELAMDGLEFKSCLIKGMDYLYVLLPVSLGKIEAAL